MSLPVWAEADEKGYSTYPEALCGQFLAKTLHIRRRGTWSLGECGVIAEANQRYLGAAGVKVKVCPACRRIAEQT